jgi:hypothetical protein
MSQITVPASTDDGAEEVVTPDPRELLVQGLREFADFIAAHPELPAPHVFARVFDHEVTPDGFRRLCEVMVPLGATVKPVDYSDKLLGLTHTFGPVDLVVAIRKDKIGEQRTVTREVTEHVLPDWAQPAETSS